MKRKDKIKEIKEVIEDYADYHKKTNDDYKGLPLSDQKLIDKIDRSLKKLSENGRDYWHTYWFVID
jgi:hypothetical protein